ncbi:hypothetical protein FN976_08975 [Caenimonas sedimenti]|uniref:Uncharacterized protein n=1 Tax=Caenimonas sedimenti TaxID=2596921 RepID=A0A562ZTB4_9BURK|nr:hypothetical protein [Caenimonas sedimenti]TWO71733.1 hypothetical protein FN976_08975 [Caenimonas sedimenti]
MKHSSNAWAPWHRSATLGATLALLLAGGAATAATTQIKGAEILAHACGKVGVKQMGLLNQGKMDEANALVTPELRPQWEKASAAERAMVGTMVKAVSPTEADYSASIRTHGVLTIDGTAATLKVEKKTTSGSGSSTTTMTQKFRITGADCLVDR